VSARTPASPPARIAFLGSPDVAVPSFEALVAAPDIEVAVVVTNPARPRGRRGAPVPTPIAQAAARHGVATLTPERPLEVVEALRAAGLDAAAVVAYGALLPAAVLDVLGLGAVNLHFSLLPRWRGAAPVQAAIRHGDTVTGVTTFVLDAGMDTGPVLASESVTIGADETAGELLDRLAVLGAPLLVRSVRDLVTGHGPRPQPREGATLAPRILPADRALDLAGDASEVVAHVRSLSPRPAAHLTLDGRRINVLRASVVTSGAPIAVPGTVVALDDAGPVLACGHGSVRLDRVVPEGRSAMSGADLVRGQRVAIGDTFDVGSAAAVVDADGTTSPGT